MSDITITVTEIVDGVSVESSPTSLTVYDGVFVNTGGGGGGGAVDSVNGHTGTVVLGASDVGAATTAQGAKADTAVQPGDLSTVATTGAYADLTGKPTLGTSAALDIPATGNATTGQVVKGTDTRLSDARTPTTHTHTASQISDSTTTGRAVVTATDAAAARTAIGAGTSSLAIGTTGTTAAAGNDSRLSDARTPTAHASSHASAGSDPITIAESQVTNLTTDLAAKAPLASPTFTGTPAAPTATAGTNTTQVATTAFVTAAVVGAGGYVDPLTTKGDIVTRTASATVRKAAGSNGQALLADSTQTDGLIWRAIAESDVTNLVTDLAAKAPTASPTLTGTVTIPTVAGTSDSTTKAASTAFVQAVAALLAPLASPALTGNPTAPTQTAGNNSTRLATTAYADNAVAKQPEFMTFALGDETTAITTGTKVTWRIPCAFTLTSVRASLTTASSSGVPAFDVKKNGTSIFSTTLTIDATEKTSVTAATAAVLSTTSLADDDELTFIVNTAGTGAAGAKITLIGTRA